MSVHKKIMQARIELQGTQLKKSGQNKFAGYSYFELGDFLPTIQEIFNRVGLCGVVSYTAEMASLTIVDTEDSTVVVITSPMAEANLKGTHPIQNLGAVETYQRRYLWMTALEIVEHDALDARTGQDEPARGKVVKVPEPTGLVPKKIEGATGPWQLKVTVNKEEGLGPWVSAVSDVTKLALTQAGSLKDIMDIFKVNRNIFDVLKTEAPDDYSKVMEQFTTYKQSFSKKD
jgi:hypothetical protein